MPEPARINDSQASAAAIALLAERTADQRATRERIERDAAHPLSSRFPAFVRLFTALFGARRR